MSIEWIEHTFERGEKEKWKEKVKKGDTGKERHNEIQFSVGRNPTKRKEKKTKLFFCYSYLLNEIKRDGGKKKKHGTI